MFDPYFSESYIADTEYQAQSAECTWHSRNGDTNTLKITKYNHSGPKHISRLKTDAHHQVENERKKKSAIQASVEEELNMFSDGGELSLSLMIILTITKMMMMIEIQAPLVYLHLRQ